MMKLERKKERKKERVIYYLSKKFTECEFRYLVIKKSYVVH
jgi:hypothetical protein